ncbi:MAG: wax ester/triacylglycerol synthase family O-acyltransferase [Burkholderiales bacterium]|nr:wax ester/triacylglycerol synthase family O-acyltransferase [Burkholderiales bacterium]
MPALSVIDLAMFLLETEERPFNIGPLIILEPPAGSRGRFADRLVARMLQRPLGSPFNYRLRTPLAGVPFLEADERADPAGHLHRLTIDPPGSMDQLCATVSRLHETRLDRSRLLWDLYVIDGLAGGEVALYGKVHHGIIDGRTFVKVVSGWLAASPRERTVRAMWEGVPRAPRESRERASLADRVGRALRRAAGTTASVARLYRMLGGQALATAGLRSGLPLPLLGVPKAFRGRAHAERSFAFCTLPLADVRAVGKANGATVNDVLLTVLDMAMARLLRERGELPDQPLVADMPLALADAHGGNRIAVLQFPLGAPGLAPLARLAAVRESAHRVKDVVRRESAETVMLYTTLVHALPALVERLGAKRGLAVSNALISNPFGLPEERYLMGARVALALPVPVVAAGQTLNVTAVTLADRLQLGFLALPNAVPHVGKLAAHTVDAFAELKRATSGTALAPPRAGRRPSAEATKRGAVPAAGRTGARPAGRRRRAAAGG